MQQKKKRQPAGDRGYIDSVDDTGDNSTGYKQSDIDGFLTKSDENGEDQYYSEDEANYDKQTGRGKGMSREEAIRVLARSEGIQNPSGDLEELLKQIIENRKKKTPPAYESPIARPGA
jgi:hypothetical protein